MRNWMAGLLAFSSTALMVAPNIASAQGAMIGVAPGGAEFGPNWYGDSGDYSFYGPGYTPPPYAVWGPPQAYRYYAPPAGSTMMYSAPMPPAAQQAPEERSAGAGGCGTFFYWSNGRCVDARMK
jgi:hypothetical protein